MLRKIYECRSLYCKNIKKQNFERFHIYCQHMLVQRLQDVKYNEWVSERIPVQSKHGKYLVVYLVVFFLVWLPGTYFVSETQI